MGGVIVMSSRYITPLDVSSIREALLVAKEKGIEKPKIRLEEYQFSLAPDHGVNRGAVYINDSLTKAYLGKVRDSSFQGSIVLEATDMQKLVDCVKRAATKDALYDSIIAYGRKTGSCSCCGRLLTNSLSISLGIGPICREKYGFYADSIEESEEELVEKYGL